MLQAHAQLNLRPDFKSVVLSVSLPVRLTDLTLAQRAPTRPMDAAIGAPTNRPGQRPADDQQVD